MRKRLCKQLLVHSLLASYLLKATSLCLDIFLRHFHWSGCKDTDIRHVSVTLNWIMFCHWPVTLPHKLFNAVSYAGVILRRRTKAFASDPANGGFHLENGINICRAHQLTIQLSASI